MTKEEEFFKALDSLYVQLGASIVDDIKQKALEALKEAKSHSIKA